VSSSSLFGERGADICLYVCSSVGEREILLSLPSLGRKGNGKETKLGSNYSDTAMKKTRSFPTCIHVTAFLRSYSHLIPRREIDPLLSRAANTARGGQQ